MNKMKMHIIVGVMLSILLLTFPAMAADELTATRDISDQTVEPGSTFTVTLTLTANEDITAPALDEDLPVGWTVTEVDSAGATYKASTTEWIWSAAMSSGASKTVIYNVTVPEGATPQTYAITGTTSAYGITSVAIGGESDVTVEGSVAISATRDISDQTVEPGSTFTVTLTLTANEDITAPALDEDLPVGWTVTEVDSAGATYKASTTEWIWSAAMSSGASKTVIYNVTVPGDATLQAYTVTGTASAYGITPVAISGESEVTVLELVGPDLTVESITPNCGYLFGNESNNISAVIKNTGDAGAGASNVSFVSGGHNETVAVSPLAAGASETVTITDPTIRSAGDAVAIIVTADCNGEVTESNETNNVSTLDVTVLNNGYKGKTYTGGSNITTVKTYELNGNLVYSVGDSYYLSGSSNPDWTAYDVAWAASDLPVSGTVREARLYVMYTWDKDGVLPDDVSVSFNGVDQEPEAAHYWDEIGFGTYAHRPYGMLPYNVTDNFNPSGNYANLTNSHTGGDNVSMRGMLLVAVYEDASEPRRLIYVNEEFDLLYGGSGKCTTPEEATAWAPITGSIDTGTVASAKLITVAPGAGPTEGELIFNGQVWTDVWNFTGDTQLGIDERDVASYLASADNLVGFQSSGDYMEASNAFLVVTVTEEAPVLTTITVTPAIADLIIGETQLFTAIAWDQHETPMAGVVITWASMNTTVGTVDPASATTDADGTATTTFTAVAEGTTTVGAYSGAVYDTAAVTVDPAVCPGDFTGDGFVNIEDVVYMVTELWGPCTPGAEGDFTGDGFVNIEDVVYMVTELWGPCP